MEKRLVKDSHGEYQVYVRTLSNGKVLEVDCALANLWRYGSDAFMDREVELAEKAIRERG